LHDFGAWAGHGEFEGLGGGSDQARSGKKAQCKGSTAKSGSWGDLCVHTFLLSVDDEQGQKVLPNESTGGYSRTTSFVSRAFPQDR
jgi:hypothetical protein